MSSQGQQPYYQQPPPPYGYQQPARTSGMAVASLVLGLLFLWGVGSILAIIFGYQGRNEIDRSGGQITGRGMATAGLVLGWIGIGGAILLTILVVSAASQLSGY
jgi:hypothetical protein